MNYKKLFVVLLISVSTIILACSCDKILDRRGTVDRVDFKVPKDKIKKTTLKNGLTILTFQTTNVPKVLLQVSYDIGSGIEEPGESGLAHLLEHMIFKGTKKLSEGDIDSIARKYGATFNAHTAKDETSYFFEVTKNNWKPFMEILADCMQNARFEQQHLNSELVTVLQEWKMSEDSFWWKTFDGASETIYPSDHPYHHPIIGYKKDLLGLTSEKLKNFYNKYYHPSKAALFVVGDFDYNEVIEEAKKHFGKIPNNPHKEEKTIPSIPKQLEPNIKNLYEDVKNDLQRFYWVIPGLKSGQDVIADVVDNVIGGGEGSYLHRRMVDEEKVAISVASGSLQLKESGLFFIFVEPKNGMRERCKEIVKSELEKLISNEPKIDDLVKTVREKEMQFLSLFQRNQSLAGEWINSYFSTKNEYDLFEKIDQFAQIDQVAVKNFIKEYLNPSVMNEINILPMPENKRSEWLENKKKSEELEIEILKEHQRTMPLEEPKFVHTMSEPNPLDFEFPKPTLTKTLENGLKIIVHEKNYIPLTHSYLKFNNANFYARTKESVLINMMMSMLIEGSDSFSKNDNVDFFELRGASYSFDASGCKLTTVSNLHKESVARMFHILTNPTFPVDSFEKLKSIYIDSYERLKDNEEEVAKRLFRSTIYKNHQFGWTIDDAINLLKNSSLEDLKKLYEKHVSPKNMFLTVVGNLNEEEIIKDAHEIFGSWQGTKSEEIKIENPQKIEPANKDHLMLKDKVILIIGKPSEIDIYHEDLITSKLLNQICFGSLGSRIFELRERGGLFYFATGGIGMDPTKVTGYDFIMALLSPKEIKSAEEQLRKLVTDIHSGGIKEFELNDAKQWYINGIISAISTNESIATIFARLEEYGLEFNYYDKALDKVQKMTIEDINAINKKYMSLNGARRIRVGRVR